MRLEVQIIETPSTSAPRRECFLFSTEMSKISPAKFLLPAFFWRKKSPDILSSAHYLRPRSLNSNNNIGVTCEDRRGYSFKR
jgi:hypothetical protein